MATTPGAEFDHSTPLALGPAPPPADGVVNELGALLRALQEQDSEARPSPPPDVAEIDNQLVQVRLGIASSLFVALQLKHAAIAGHALRVALTTSAWAVKLGLPPQERDAIEIAALLHDVGAIGIPDDVLNKPAPLDADEVTRMAGVAAAGAGDSPPQLRRGDPHASSSTSRSASTTAASRPACGGGICRWARG